MAGGKPQPTVKRAWKTHGGWPEGDPVLCVPIHCFPICCLTAFAFLAASCAHLSFLFGHLSPLRTLGPVHYFRVSSCNVRHLNVPGAQAHSHSLQIFLASFALLLTVPRACEGVQSADLKLLVWRVQGWVLCVPNGCHFVPFWPWGKPFRRLTSRARVPEHHPVGHGTGSFSLCCLLYVTPVSGHCPGHVKAVL